MVYSLANGASRLGQPYERKGEYRLVAQHDREALQRALKKRKELE